VQFYKVNCFKVVGSVSEVHAHFVVASSPDDATAAVIADAASMGDTCHDQQVISMHTDVIVGN
jgi:hypothetical protein